MGKKFNRWLRNAARLGIPVGDLNQASATFTGQTPVEAPTPPEIPKPPTPAPPPLKTSSDSPKIRRKKSRRQSLGIGRRSRSQTRVPLNTGGSTGGINI